ncbi:TauD/TfdA family dioxygenase [Nocardia salmonicida]|uniref:TauD/TfdA family dioxygenase n=1 Tax=Nocardia salmonicida TaxID=53431 RepID=UPI002E2C1DF0|nr:TauD/TfdA family dioxygenase [Nocardia salmonicida]
MGRPAAAESACEGAVMPNHPTSAVEPTAASVAIIGACAGDVAATIADVGPEIRAAVRETGAVLVRGFDTLSVDEFATIAVSLLDDIVSDNSEHERVGVSGMVQTPVPFSPQQKLLWHNENSFNRRWPLTLLFSPTVIAPVGGRTPLTDSRQLLKILDPAIVARFRDRGIAYIRRFGTSVGLPWQRVFGTHSRLEVDDQAATDRVELDWRPDQTLSTRAVRPAVVAHPLTGELAWFAQPAHWHPACLDMETREAMLEVFGHDGLPRDCQFGDGAIIPDSMMREILDAYESIERSFDWKVGDVLAIDNVLTAHAREPYTGARRLLVAIGDEHEFAGRVGHETVKVSR